MSSGRLEASDDNIKRVSVVMEAYSKMSREVYQDKMLSVFGVEDDKLKDISKNNSEKVLNIKALPFSSNRNEIFKALSRQSLFIMPSLHEGFGLTGLEAISMEIPLVITFNSGLYQMLEELSLSKYVYVVFLTGDNDNDINQIYKAMNDIYINKKEYIENAKKLKEKLLEKTSWKKISLLIESTLEDKPEKFYFPVKSLDEIDKFKNNSNNFHELKQYLFLEFKKIMDENNGKLEKMYGSLFYQIVLVRINSEKLEEEALKIDLSLMEDSKKLREEIDLMSKYYENIREYMQDLDETNIFELLDNVEIEHMYLDVFILSMKDEHYNESSYIIYDEFKDAESEIDEIIEHLEKNISDIHSEIAIIESNDNQEVGNSMNMSNSDELKEKIDEYSLLLDELALIKIEFEKFDKIDISTFEELYKDYEYLQDELDENREANVTNYNQLLDFLNRKKNETENKIEKVYIEYCLAVYDKIWSSFS